MTMTREEAIRHIMDVIAENNSIKPNIVTFEQEKEALYMAIEALQREEAEEKGWCHRIRPKNVEVVVRCKDCRYFKKIVERSDSGLCHRDIVASAWKENGYCSRGERKGGEDE